MIGNMENIVKLLILLLLIIASGTLFININHIKKTNPNVDMWEVLIKINDWSKIRSAFAGDEF